MLTLTRRIGQEIRIGDGIRILVKEIKGRQVRLGIEAPPGIPIYREEIYQDIIAEMGQAIAPDTDLLDSVIMTIPSEPENQTSELSSDEESTKSKSVATPSLTIRKSNKNKNNNNNGKGEK